MPENLSNPDSAFERSSIDAAGAQPGDKGAVPANEILMERVRSRDESAMAQVFDRYAKLVYSVALRVLKDPMQAEDVMQDIFVQVWNEPDRFVRGRGSLPAWLAVVSRNRSIDALRQRRPTDSSDDVVLASTTNLASDVEHTVMIEKVRRVLKGLPQEQQSTVELAFFEGLTHSEIAVRTGDPLGTVKTRIRSALSSLRKGITG